MEELHGHIGAEGALQVGEAEGFEVAAAHEACDIVEQEDAVDGGECLALQFDPIHEKVSNDGEQTMHLLGRCFEGLEELRGAHQKGCDIEWAASDGETDLVAGGFDLRLEMLKAFEDEGEQTVLAGVGRFEAVDAGR